MSGPLPTARRALASALLVALGSTTVTACAARDHGRDVALESCDESAAAVLFHGGAVVPCPADHPPPSSDTAVAGASVLAASFCVRGVSDDAELAGALRCHARHAVPTSAARMSYDPLFAHGEVPSIATSRHGALVRVDVFVSQPTAVREVSARAELLVRRSESLVARP
ncbi:MAG: hypothetical protein JST00_08115 [Deltaproteobacteria bacterium]|nr:hypothetical protein [Deltaproteobacteria bacterium]